MYQQRNQGERLVYAKRYDRRYTGRKHNETDGSGDGRRVQNQRIESKPGDSAFDDEMGRVSVWFI